MTDHQATATVDSYRDEACEWRCLSALVDSKDTELVDRISPALFTGRRVTVLTALQEANACYGEVTYEGIRNKLSDGKMPNELAASQGANVRACIDELARLARKRQAARIAATMSELAKQHDPKIDAIQAGAIVEPIMADEDSSLIIGAQQFLTELSQKRSGEYRLTKSGFKFLDRSMGGEYKPQTLIIYAGGPGSGKTTLVAQSMLAMAEGYTNDKTGEHIVTPSLFLSLEMSKKDILLKWLGNRLDIDTQDILAGNLTDEEFKAIEEQTIYFQRLPAYIIDKPALTVQQMRYEIRKHIYRYGVKVVFIDYLQIVNHSPTGSKNDDLGDFAKRMKDIADEEHITIFILSQITPSNDGVFRIRNSGDVPAHADVIFEVELETEDLGAIKNVIINRTKNRLGPTGKTAALFNAPYQRFEEGTG